MKYCLIHHFGDNRYSMILKKNFFDFEKKEILITGAYSQIGEELCFGFGNYGATLLINGVNKKKLIKLQKKLKYMNIISKIACFDITNYKKTRLFIKKLKTLDVIIHNANKTSHKPLEQFDKKNYIKTYEVAILALTNLINCSLELLKQSAKKNKTSSVINISSIYGLVSPDPNIYNNIKVANSAQYGAAKASIIQHTKFLAVHLGRYNIRVNSISPGAFPNMKIQKDEKFMKKLKSKSPLNRFGRPEELITGALYLASKSSSFTTGSNLVIDGGWTIW